MHRLAWIVGSLVFACGGGSEGSNADAGSDASVDVVHEPIIACDFPCFVPWSCIDSTHWVEMQTYVPPNCNSGAMCKSTGITHACDPGLTCVTDPPPSSKVPCAYGRVEGCMPGDAGAFTPDAMAAAPTRQVGVCDQTTIEQFWVRCIDPTTKDESSCTYWSTNNKACGTCLGPTLSVAPSDVQNQYPTPVPNVGGCYALLGAPACASADDANMQCAIAACTNGCQDDPNAYAACIIGARTTTCASFPICDADAGSAYATCEPKTTKDFFIAFGEALCGP
jgi:hypothetical protein